MRRLDGGTAPKADPDVAAVRWGSRVALHDLHVQRDGDEYLLGRMATGVFVAVPTMAARSIELLRQGHTCGQVRALLRQQAGVDADIVRLVEDLARLGLVESIDGDLVSPPSGEAARPPHLSWLAARHLRWVFPRPVAWMAALVVAAAVVTMTLEPALLPGYRDYFWASSTSAAVLVNVVLGTGAIGMHELAHLVAARAYGLPARISVSTRLVFLAAQTDVSAAWSLPRRHRCRIYLAGMAWDLLLLSAMVLARAYAPLPPALKAAAGALAVLLLHGLVVQGHVYMRTDLYFVLHDLLGCRNLHGDAVAYLRWRLRRRCGSRADAEPLAGIPPAERVKVHAYAWFMLVGSTLALGWFALYLAPITVTAIHGAAVETWQALRSRNLGPGLIALTALVFLVAAQGLLVTLLLRKLLAHRPVLRPWRGTQVNRTC